MLEPGDVVLRRTPFSDNPTVGVRGQRTQQRILDAALQAFGDVGYHQCSIDTVTTIAGCSRISFYQYFSSKEDVYRRLAVRVARRLNASTDRLDPVTADEPGWHALRAWIARFVEIYERYYPVFQAFAAAAATDASLDVDAPRMANRYLAVVRSRVAGSDLPTRELGAVIDLLHDTLVRALDDVSTLRAAAPDSYPDDLVVDAFADLVHRSLFGVRHDVNTHHHRVRRPPRLALGRVMHAADIGDGESRDGPARASLLEAAHGVFVSRGFHGTRVDDIVEAAGLSHGAFYRYFKNKDELAQLLAAQAMRKISLTLSVIPDLADESPQGRAALRRWLRAYNRAQSSETAMIRVWVDAVQQDDTLRTESAAVLDWGRRRLAHVLEPRAFGNADVDATLLLAVLDTFGMRVRTARAVDAAALVIERGFLGRVSNIGVSSGGGR